MSTRFVKIIQLFIIAILIYFFISKIDISNFLLKFNFNFFMAILIAQVPLFISIFLTAYRHLYFVNNPNLNFSIALKAIIIGTGFNYILPGRISELLKATYIRDKCNIPLGIGVGSVFLERFTDLIVVAFLGLVSIIFFALDFNIYLALSILGISFLLIIVIIHYEAYILSMIQRIIKWKTLQDLIKNIFSHIHQQLNKEKLFYGLLQGITIWFFSALTVGVFMNIAGDLEFNTIAVITLLIGGAIGLAIPALPGGLGTFEAVAVVVMMKFGYDFDTALALAIGLRLSNMLLILPLALIISTKNGTGLYKLINDAKGRSKQDNE